MTKDRNFVSLMFSLLALVATSAYEHERPIIGMLTQPEKDHTFIYTAYVKWLEAFGARTIPIPYHADNKTVEDIFNQVNGVLFTGGKSHLPDAARKIWELAKEANENGDKFPLWGTCLGFQFMLQLSSDAGKGILQGGYDAENISMPLIFTEAGENDSVVFSDTRIREIAKKQAVTMNDHMHGVEPDAFMADEGLTSMFKITSINVDRNGHPFVSSMEAVNSELYPFFGLQWHAEKNSHSMASIAGTDIPYEDVNHSQDACEVALAMAGFFVSQARQSRHVYTEVEKYPLIWTYEIRQVGAEHKYEQYFVIPNESFLVATVKKMAKYVLGW
mmetsp:Transcript_10640/g.14900  ORF Transcript_10640/g.14900 Transcript_10640/m.14900 type:complete len:331 (-) Transcript_10640:451-1443(-)|eukprot:CAMPEP_0185723638 /NCGR_PEP_ID=MMETSP1171-20130828/415_1 /TAXON_ID=374046 /ORGANISM="Helicotheca tamensis, Strain CCMP826" /LENGTH=330 /DNA_ID=CAMNT_0028391373 /DNA_START=160 /DNA_END=1149 /DNA_ORIENTATION=+